VKKDSLSQERAAMKVKFLLRHLRHIPFYLIPIAACLLPLTSAASAQSVAVPPPSDAPLEAELLGADVSLAERNVITANTISQTGVTEPSLWWAKEQFAGKMVLNWLAYPDEGRVDVIVNRQYWSILDYIGRYSFINKFGTTARDYGYNIRVFDDQQVRTPNEPVEPIATYTCNFSTEPLKCSIEVQSLIEGLQVNRGAATARRL
jgi:hypothetical protein